jgi:lipopolysaccharide transport system ATP-binding protein
MCETSIRVEGLGKRYRIGALQQRHDTLRDALAGTVRGLARRGTAAGGSDESIWALKDVSFELKRGEVVGIIGRNGAGKSTLLKILSRITRPTEGYAEVAGRVGSLLEVGTGFHPELTGRENIYLNGAILGMRKTEIERKFDEIVAFAEVESFLDTPVKHYSSGMYVRLAFAVAAHLEPEILLVDEVLAVGDVAFQKKCLGKMGEVTGEGRTVLFVSHNMVSVQSLCRRAFWLDRGAVAQVGPVPAVIGSYLKSMAGALGAESVWTIQATAPGNQQVRLRRVFAGRADSQADLPIAMDTPVVIETEFWNLVAGATLHLVLHVYTDQGIVAFTSGSDRELVYGGHPLPAGLFRAVCQVPGNLFNSGMHRIDVLVVKDLSQIIYQHPNAVALDIVDVEPRGGAWFGREPGAVQPRLQWNTTPIDAWPGETAGVSYDQPRLAQVSAGS